MPFIPNTPESLSTILSATSLPPATCCGVTNTGRPCTRVLKSAPSGAPTSGIIAIVASQRVFFCETHKDQATNVVLRHTASFARRREAVGRGSMDTFIEQVELLVGTPGGTTTTTRLTAKTKRHDGGGGNVDPFSHPEKYQDAPAAEASPPSPPTGYKRRQKQQRRKKPSLLRRLLCCMSSSGDEEDYSLSGKKQAEAELRVAAAAVVEGNIVKPARTHRKDNRESHVLFETTPPTPPLPMMYPNRKPAASAVAQRPNTYGAMAAQGATPASGYFVDPTADPATQFNSYIPPHLSQSTQARLRAELAKPFSDGDEPGYIYVFWLTDSPISPASTPGGKQTTAAALLKTAAAAESLPRNTASQPRLLLKIGRANNVQRRLHEWSTQCGYNLSLVRFYPHVSASATPSPATTPGSRRAAGPPSTPFLHTLVGKKVPNSHRIERLIHLELRDEDGRNPEILCKACGKTHKEWFWIDASRDGLHGVDEVVKKWIDYGEKSAMVAGVPRTSPGSTTPKKSKKADSSGTPSPLQKRPSLKDAGVGGKSGKTPAGGSNHLSPGAGKSVAASPARSGRGTNASRPGSSAGKGPAGKSRGRGGRKTRDDDDGSDEYRPDSDNE